MYTKAYFTMLENQATVCAIREKSHRRNKEYSRSFRNYLGFILFSLCTDICFGILKGNYTTNKACYQSQHTIKTGNGQSQNIDLCINVFTVSNSYIPTW